jgi:hypothetical protein
MFKVVLVLILDVMCISWYHIVLKQKVYFREKHGHLVVMEFKLKVVLLFDVKSGRGIDLKVHVL